MLFRSPCRLAASTFNYVVRTFLESLEYPCDSGGRSTGLLSLTPDAAEPMLISIWCIVRSYGFRFLRGTHYLVTGTPRTLWSTTTCCIVQMQDLDAKGRKGLFLAVDRRTVFKASAGLTTLSPDSVDSPVALFDSLRFRMSCARLSFIGGLLQICLRPLGKL